MENINNFDERIDDEKSRYVRDNDMPVIRENIKLSKPRPEYKRGELKLDFQYQFTSGEILRATENGDGIASIIILRNDIEILDFKKYIPENLKMVTPTYLRANGLKEYSGDWGMGTGDDGDKLIIIGDMRNGRHLLVLLHELGHIELHGWDEKIMEELRKNEEISVLNKPAFSKYIEANSANERGAWAKALRISREIKIKYGVNLLEAIGNLEDLNEIIYAALMGHRNHLERVIIGEAETKRDNQAGELDEETKEITLALLDDIKKIFDKEKLID